MCAVKVAGIVTLAILVASCRSEKPLELRATAQDGSSVELRIAFRPAGCSDDSKPVDCYYYIAKLTPKTIFSPEFRSGVGYGQDAGRDSICVVASRMNKTPYAWLHLRFYDMEGFSLFRNVDPVGDGNALSPGWNDVPDEVAEKNGVWTWNGKISVKNLDPKALSKPLILKAELQPGCDLQ